MPLPFLSYTDEDIFQCLNGVLLAWVLLIVAPKWRPTQAIVLLSAMFYSALYAALIFNMIYQGGALDFAAMSTLPGVAKLFATPEAVLPAWVHYIAFDLWTGRWIAMDAASRQIPRLLIAPILVATLMLGPCGLFVYLMIRGSWRVKTVKIE